MSSIEENTVPSYNQLKGAPSCYTLKPDGRGLRVLFIGNSITLHGIMPEIGWHNLCGMAASCVEKDYVHLCMDALLDYDSEATFSIAQLADWEREYTDGSNQLSKYSACRDFNADIIIVRIIENCPYKEFAHEAFQKEYKTMLDYFNKSGKAKIILTDSFWCHPGDASIKAVAEKYGYLLVNLGDLGENPEMKAIGEYEHGGVAQHPNDNGMAHIAERIINTLKTENII